MTDSARPGFWTTLPGLLTGLAALITALGGAWLGFRPAPKPAERTAIILQATRHSSGPDVAPALNTSAPREFGDVLMNREPPDNTRPNWADWRFEAPPGGTYMLRIEYAAGEARPLQVLVNETLVFTDALNAATGCWEQRCQAWREVGRVTLAAGHNVLRLDRREGVFPHLRTIRLEPVN